MNQKPKSSKKIVIGQKVDRIKAERVIDGFIIDFYCHAVGLIVEVDGKVHLQQQAYDEQRDQILAARDLRILRIPAEDIRRDLKIVLARIATACRETNTASGDVKG